MLGFGGSMSLNFFCGLMSLNVYYPKMLMNNGDLPWDRIRRKKTIGPRREGHPWTSVSLPPSKNGKSSFWMP